ncbi:MAG: hypothetical protein ACFFC7_26865 [Candidatus Hermodarchaeota archaeon]
MLKKDIQLHDYKLESLDDITQLFRLYLCGEQPILQGQSSFLARLKRVIEGVKSQSNSDERNFQANLSEMFKAFDDASSKVETDLYNHLTQLVDETSYTESESLQRIKEFLDDEIYVREANKILETKIADLADRFLRKKEITLKCEEFNEILLFLKQPRVTKDFFDFFFPDGISNREELLEGISRFRLYAMLCYGNFRYAFKDLCCMRLSEIEEMLKDFRKRSDKVEEELEAREFLLDIDRIKRDSIPFLGYLSRGKLEYEDKLLKDKQDEGVLDEEAERSLVKLYEELNKRARKAITQGIFNTELYLTWNHMDCYIATSMRKEWHFWSTFDALVQIFEKAEVQLFRKPDTKTLKEMNVRHFDPTQSATKSKERINKTLIEGLMLKRASLCVYMAQESDTLGKDSELASTLAQGKIVIIFIPDEPLPEIIERFKTYPLSFIRSRWNFFQENEFIRKPVVQTALQAKNYVDYQELSFKLSTDQEKEALAESLNSGDIHDYPGIIEQFLKIYEEYELDQPFSYWERKNQEFREKNQNLFNQACEIIAIIEKEYFDSRANTLKKVHPLAIQVSLESGVANGVLVVRKEQDCAQLIYKVLTNNLSFTIEHDSNESCTVLREMTSGCVFRVVTDDLRLTNTFWNFYAVKKSLFSSTRVED